MVAQRSVFGVFGCFERLFSNALFGRSTTSEARMIFLQAELGLQQELRRSVASQTSSGVLDALVSPSSKLSLEFS